MHLSNAKLSSSSFFAGLRIPLDQSPGLFGLAYGYVSNDLFILVMIELAAFFTVFPVVGMHLFFTESLILAQDERWRRA